MDSERAPRLKDLPPEEHAIGVYIGLLIGGLVLGIGAVVLFRDLFFTFAAGGIELNDVVIFRILLFLASAFASLACFFGLFKLIFLQRSQVKKVDGQFKDFATYARPLVEEVIRQRIISEDLSEKLDRISSRREVAAEPFARHDMMAPSFAEYSKRTEFLVFVAILSSISIGLFIYLEMHPWELVPYSVMILAVAWWFVIAKYFDMVYDIRSYYIPAVFILLMPSLSVIFRAFMQPYQAVYVVFSALFVYVWGMYTYFNYVRTGAAPELVSMTSAKLMGFPPTKRFKKFAENDVRSPRIDRLLPPKKGTPSGKEADNNASQRMSDLLPPKNGGPPDKKTDNGLSPRINGLLPPTNGPPTETKVNKNMSPRINDLLPQKEEEKHKD